MGGRVCVFKFHHRIQLPKTSKNTCFKGKTHSYLFSYYLYNFVQLKSSDYYDGVSAKLKYLNAYDYIFNPACTFHCKFVRQPFWIQGKHTYFTPKESNLYGNSGRCLKCFRFFCFMLRYSKAIIHFYCSFKLQPPTFCISVF